MVIHQPQVDDLFHGVGPKDGEIIRHVEVVFHVPIVDVLVLTGQFQPLLVWRDFDPYGFKPQFQPYLSTFDPQLIGGRPRVDVDDAVAMGMDAVVVPPFLVSEITRRWTCRVVVLVGYRLRHVSIVEREYLVVDT